MTVFIHLAMVDFDTDVNGFTTDKNQLGVRLISSCPADSDELHVSRWFTHQVRSGHHLTVLKVRQQTHICMGEVFGSFKSEVHDSVGVLLNELLTEYPLLILG